MKPFNRIKSAMKTTVVKWGTIIGMAGVILGISSNDSFGQTMEKKSADPKDKNKTGITVGNVTVGADVEIITDVKPVYDDSGNVIGQEKNGLFYYPEKTEVRGDTTITTYGHGSLYKETIDGQATVVKPSDIVPTKATNEQIQTYKERWAKLQKENNWTDEQLRAAQREEDRKYREYLASLMSGNTTTSSQETALAVEKLVIKEIKGKSEILYQTSYSVLPHLAPIPVVTEDSWLFGGGVVERETGARNRTPFETTGIMAQMKSASLFNREIIKIGMAVESYKGFEYATIIPEYVEQNDEANINAFDAFINKGGVYKRHLEAQLYASAGYTFNFFRPNNDLNPELYTVNPKDLDKHNRFKHLGAVKLEIAADVGLFGHQPFEYTVKPNEWDPAPAYIIPPEQQNAEPGIAPYYGGHVELSINMGKILRCVASQKTGEWLSLEEYEAKRQAFLDEFAEDAVIVSETKDAAANQRNAQNAVELMQLKTIQKLREFEENHFKLKQKRTGVELFIGGNFMRTTFKPTNVAPFSNEGVIGEGEGTFVTPDVTNVYGGLRLRF